MCYEVLWTGTNQLFQFVPEQMANIIESTILYWYTISQFKIQKKHFHRDCRGASICATSRHILCCHCCYWAERSWSWRVVLSIWCSYSWRNSSDIRFKQFQWQSWDILWDGRVPLSTGCRTTVYTTYLHTGIVSMSAPLIFTLFTSSLWLRCVVLG